MKRGSIMTVAAGGGYAGKPRPALVLQADAFQGLASVTVCLLTSVDEGGPDMRIRITPSSENGLGSVSFAMVDKITIIPLAKVGPVIGSVDAVTMRQITIAALLFLGLTG